MLGSSVLKESFTTCPFLKETTLSSKYIFRLEPLGISPLSMLILSKFSKFFNLAQIPFTEAVTGLNGVAEVISVGLITLDTRSIENNSLIEYTPPVFVSFNFWLDFSNNTPAPCLITSVLYCTEVGIVPDITSFTLPLTDVINSSKDDGLFKLRDAFWTSSSISSILVFRFCSCEDVRITFSRLSNLSAILLYLLFALFKISVAFSRADVVSKNTSIENVV